MELIETAISGCYELQPVICKDNRGSFVKTFHTDIFAKYGLVTNFMEEYYSISKKNVLRGLHFQIPPKQHTKLVYCISGEVLDVVVDLRKQSDTYKQYQIFNISSEKTNMIYIPEGMAHGFFVLSDIATMMYKVTSVYSQENDCGVLWNSAGIPWPNMNPIVSNRDNTFSPLDNFKSPF